MKAAIRQLTSVFAHRLGRGTLAALLMAIAFMPGTPAVQPADAAPAAAVEESVASTLRPEVRLRKLHLVRPDLIMYPLAYDIYC